jgi:hypothetical protein
LQKFSKPCKNARGERISQSETYDPDDDRRAG